MLPPRTAAASDRAATVEDFGETQDAVPRDLPVRQDKQYAVAHGDVSGLERTPDASTVFRFREIGEGAAG
ncbi:hypothetical protein ACGRHY_22405 [Streptomyces sp. HK10]|uniref:hypothetical protein n=1 Tax=Streptomyces sp. HK10 TaxID=3373255 RepID=UPI003748AC8E